MKKTLLTLAIIASAAAAYAQGFVYFGNAGNTHTSTNSAVGGTATGLTAANGGTTATTYYFALFSSSSAPSSSAAIVGTSASTYAFQNGSGWTFDNPSSTSGYLGAAYATNNSTAGQFTATDQDPNNSNQSLLASGAAQYFVVVGWSANIGSTLAALESWYANPTVAGWVGESAASGSITPAAPGGSEVSVMGHSAPGIPGFTLGDVTPVPSPEPATMALAAIGGASLLLFRRKK